MTIRQALFGLFLSTSLASTLTAVSNPRPFLSGQGRDVSFRGFEDDAGGFYVAWTGQEAGKVVSLCAQHFDAQGLSTLGDTGVCISARLALATDWSGLADGRGGLILFWDEKDGVHAKRFRPDSSGDSIGNSILMSSSTAIQPDAVPDAAGGTLVAWRQMMPALGRSVIEAQRLDTEGKPVWPKGGLRVSLRASDQTNPRVIYDNLSGMIVAWRDEVNQASELRAQRMDFQGNRLWGAEGIKIMGPIGKSEFPRLAPLSTGEVVFTWNASAEQTNQIFLQKVGPEPKLKWGNMTLASNVRVSYNRWNPLLVGDEDGGTWIGWEDFRDQINYQIQLNHLDGNGKTVWPAGEIAVAPAPGDQGKLAMTGDGFKGVWLAWIDNRLSTVGLYAQQVDQTGAKLQGSKGKLIADQLTKPSNPQLISIAAGKAVVLWANRPKKDQWQLFWSKIEAPPARP